MATVNPDVASQKGGLRQLVDGFFYEVGDVALFALRVLGWAFRPPHRGTLLQVFYTIGVLSIPVVLITGGFIGMVLAVQTYTQFSAVGLETQLGAIINLTVVRELGPVLAATMLAGRVGSAMAAELATMRITEQIDAIACLGANPIHYLIVPRFLACVLLIPLLTVLANFMGVMGGALVCTKIFHIDVHHYWSNARGAIKLYDVITGLIKPTFFGAAIAIISCHRGLNSESGAEGVGRAATVAFVRSFVVILALDFMLAMFLNRMFMLLYPDHRYIL